MKSKGFTIVELIVTMIIVGILSAVTAVAISRAMQGIQLSSTADRLASDLRYAQTMANATGIWYGVSFEVNQYAVYATEGGTDMIVDNPAKRGSNFIVIISGATVESGQKIIFDPLGTPYAADRSPFTAEAVVTLRQDSSSRTVRIVPRTGRVYVQ